MSLDLICHEVAVDLASPRVVTKPNVLHPNRNYSMRQSTQQQFDCLNNDAVPMCIEIPPFPDLSQYDNKYAVAHVAGLCVDNGSGRDVSSFVSKMIKIDANEERENSKLEGPPRLMLLEWLNELCCVLRLRRTTFYLTVDYIERFLAVRQNMNKGTLQLLAVTALWDAAKIEELVPPSVSDLAYVTDKAFTEQDILSLEVDLVRELSYVLSPHTVDNYVKLYLQAYSKHIKSTRCRRPASVFDRRTPSKDVIDSSPSRVFLPPSTTSISPEKSLTPQSPMRYNSNSSEDDDLTEKVPSPCISRSRESRDFNQLRHKYLPNQLFRPGPQPSTVPTKLTLSSKAVFLDPTHWRLTDEDCADHFSQVDNMFDDIACNALWAHDCCGDYSWAPPYNVLLYVKAMRVLDLLLVESSWSSIPYAIWAAAVLFHFVGPTIISVIDFPVEHIDDLERAIVVSAPFVQAVYEIGVPSMSALDAKQGEVKVLQRRAAMPYYVRTACEQRVAATAADGNSGSAAFGDANDGVGSHLAVQISTLSDDERNLLEFLYTAPKIESSFDVNESTTKLCERAIEISKQMYAARHVIREKVYRALFMHMRSQFQELFDYKPFNSSAATATSGGEKEKPDFVSKNVTTNFYNLSDSSNIFSVSITQPFKEHRRLRQQHINRCLQQQRSTPKQLMSRENSGRKSSASSASGSGGRSSVSPLVSGTAGGFALPITPQRRPNAAAIMSPPLTGFVGCKLPAAPTKINVVGERNWTMQTSHASNESLLMRRKLQLQQQKTPENLLSMAGMSAEIEASVDASICTPPDSAGKGAGGADTAGVRDELNDILQQEETQQNFAQSRRRANAVVVQSNARQSKNSIEMPFEKKQNAAVAMPRSRNAAVVLREKSNSNATAATLLSARTTSEDDVKFVEQRRSLRKAVVLNAATQAAATAADVKKMGPPPVPSATQKPAASRKRRSTSRSSSSAATSASTSTSTNRRVAANNSNKQMKTDLTQTFLTPAVPPPLRPTRAAAAARKVAAAGASSSSQTQLMPRQAKIGGGGATLTLVEMWNLQSTGRNSSASMSKK